MVEVRIKLDLSLVKETLRYLLMHHDELRGCFEQGERGWIQFTAGENIQEIPFMVLDLSELEPEDFAAKNCRRGRHCPPQPGYQPTSIDERSILTWVSANPTGYYLSSTT